MPAPAAKAPWTLDVQTAYSTFGSSPKGLSAAEAATRLKTNGPNTLATDQTVPAWRILLEQFTSPLILILVGASVLSFALGEGTEASIILLMVLLSGLLAFYQEFRSEKALRQLRVKLSRQAQVVRGGVSKRIDATELVVGDLVELELGSVVPADLRLVGVNDLEMDESMLTGESVPVAKTTQEVGGAKLAPQDRVNIAFMGSHAVQGSGLGIVIAVAAETEMGKTANLLTKRTDETEFQQGIRSFGNFLLKVTIALSIIVAGILGLLHGQWAESLLFALALAVGISPELLPVIVTINLSRGALLMSKKFVLVKRLISIEDLGSADVLCTDKTGTLTVGTLRVRDAITPDGASNPLVLDLAAQCIDLAKDGRATNPIDQAILNAGTKTRSKVYDEVAFDFSRRRMSCVIDDGKGGRTLVVKGATDEVIKQCSTCIEGTGTCPLPSRDQTKMRAFADSWHDKGYRLVAVARRPINAQTSYSQADEKDLELVGFILVSDAPKQTAKSSLAALAALHVRVVILTGDNARVTAYVAQQLGFKVQGVLEGEQLDALNDAELDAAVEKTNVFAKITPAHKLRVIQALKRRKHVVAFMGDGVNDAPALREADAGISFHEAVDVAREAAGIILLKKKLSVLADGIREGRKTFINTRTYIHATISSNFGNMLSVAGASLILPFIPLLPAQILLLNLIGDIPMLAIPTDNVSDEDVAEPLRWDIKDISTFMYFFGPISSLADYVMFGVFLYVLHTDTMTFRSAWFVGSLLTQVLVIQVLRRRRFSLTSQPSMPLVLTSLAVMAGIVVLVQTGLGSIVELYPLSAETLGAICLIVIGYVGLTELGKIVYYRQFKLAK